MPLGVSTRNDEKYVVPSGAVLRAQTIHRSSQAPRARAVEVCDLNNPHIVNLTGTRVQSTT
jgi:hypothetical protein